MSHPNENIERRLGPLPSNISACEKSVEQIVDRIIGLRESELTLEVLLSDEDDVRRWKEQGRVVERMKELCKEYSDLIQNFVNEAADKKNRCITSSDKKLSRSDSAELEELVEMAEAVNRLVQATVLSIHDRTRGFKERKFDRTRIWLSDSLKQVRINVGGAVNALAAYIARNKYKAIGVALLTGWAAYSGVLSAPIRIFAANLQIAPSKMQAFMWSLHEVLHKSCSTLLCNPVGLVFIAVIFGGALLLRLHKPLYQLVFSGGNVSEVDEKDDSDALQDAKRRRAKVYNGIFRTEIRNRKKEREAAFKAAEDYVEASGRGIDKASLDTKVRDAIRLADLSDLESLETQFQSDSLKLAVIRAIRKVREETGEGSLPSMDPSLTPIAERILNRTGSAFSVDSLVVLLDKVYRALVLTMRPADALRGALPTEFLQNLSLFTPPGVNERFMTALHMLSRLMGASPFTSLVATFGNPILSASGVACNLLCGTSRAMGGVATTIHTATDFKSSPVLAGVNAVTFFSSFVGILFKFGGIGKAAMAASGIGKVVSVGSALFNVFFPFLLPFLSALLPFLSFLPFLVFFSFIPFHRSRGPVLLYVRVYLCDGGAPLARSTGRGEGKGGEVVSKVVGCLPLGRGERRQQLLPFLLRVGGKAEGAEEDGEVLVAE